MGWGHTLGHPLCKMGLLINVQSRASNSFLGLRVEVRIQSNISIPA